MSIRLEAIDDNLLNVHDGESIEALLTRNRLGFSVDAILRCESCWCLFNDDVMKALNTVPSWSMSSVVFVSAFCGISCSCFLAALAAGVTQCSLHAVDYHSLNEFGFEKVRILLRARAARSAHNLFFKIRAVYFLGGRLLHYDRTGRTVPSRDGTVPLVYYRTYRTGVFKVLSL
jgi:hypothetical protein